jgi:transposase
VIESVELQTDARGAEVLVASVRAKAGAARRCSRCQRRCPGYDTSRDPRRWRGLDLGTTQVFLQATTSRVSCPEHGVVVAAVPWARPGSRFTAAFEDTCAWLVCHAALSVVAILLRVAWRSVSDIIARVVAERAGQLDRLAGLRRIGIDEISYKRGYRFLTVVVDHDSGRLVWAAPGKERRTLEAFFTLLGEDRCQKIRLVSADGAEYIAKVVAERCPNAAVCADPFHVVSWATKALDEVRREVWNQARGQGGDKAGAKALQRCRYALWKNPENLTERQRGKLAWVAKTNERLYRAYLLKEELRLVFHLEGEEAKVLLRQWLAWASRCRIPAFVELAAKIRAHLPSIHATLEHGLSNGLVESTNTKVRLLTRMAFGFRSPEALVALALLDRGGYCPPLPGRG